MGQRLPEAAQPALAFVRFRRTATRLRAIRGLRAMRFNWLMVFPFWTIEYRRPMAPFRSPVLRRTVVQCGGANEREFVRLPQLGAILLLALMEEPSIIVRSPC